MKTSAWLIMDVQNVTVRLLGDDAERFLTALNQTATAARAADVPVIFIRMGFVGERPR